VSSFCDTLLAPGFADDFPFAGGRLGSAFRVVCFGTETVFLTVTFSIRMTGALFLAAAEDLFQKDIKNMICTSQQEWYLMRCITKEIMMRSMIAKKKKDGEKSIAQRKAKGFGGHICESDLEILWMFGALTALRWRPLWPSPQ
jgi:hypothetical protein